MILIYKISLRCRKNYHRHSNFDRNWRGKTGRWFGLRTLGILHDCKELARFRSRCHGKIDDSLQSKERYEKRPNESDLEDMLLNRKSSNSLATPRESRPWSRFLKTAPMAATWGRWSKRRKANPRLTWNSRMDLPLSKGSWRKIQKERSFWSM